MNQKKILVVIGILFSLVLAASSLALTIQDNYNESSTKDNISFLSHAEIACNGSDCFNELNYSMNQSFAGTGTYAELSDNTWLLTGISDIFLVPFSVLSENGFYIKALLTYENLTPISSEELMFYGDETFIGSNITVRGGWSQISWFPNTSGTYTVNITYAGNQNLSTLPSFNYTHFEFLQPNQIQPTEPNETSANRTKITKIIPEITPVLTANKKHFDLNENPAFEFEYLSEEEIEKIHNVSVMGLVSPMSAAGIVAAANETIEAFVYDSSGELLDFIPDIEKIRDGKFSVSLLKERSFPAGIYKLRIELTKDDVIYIREQEFQWGLVSLNTEKSIYRPGETAEFIIVVLDEEGYSVCDADIDMTVFDSLSGMTDYSTGDGTITAGLECGLYGADYLAQSEGNHMIYIAAQFSGIEVDFSTHFLVQEIYEFDIIRTAQSKIDPTKQDWFDVMIDIESFTDVGNVAITEFVPSVFELETDATVITDGDIKVLVWGKSLISSRTSVSYSYSVPDIWPYLYALGPAEITYGTKTFTEARPWYVAVDPVNQLFYEDWEANSFGNWTNTAWTIVSGDRQQGTYGSKCPNDANCDMNTNVGIDASSADEINVTFMYNDDDCDPEDVIIYFNDSDGAWINMGSIDATSLGGSDDTWNTYTVSTTASQYQHAGFSVRFWADPEGNGANDENYWLDNINVTVLITDSTPPAIQNEALNTTEIDINEAVRLNATTSDPETDVTDANFTIKYPNGTSANLTATEVSANYWEYNFSDTSQRGQYNWTYTYATSDGGMNSTITGLTFDVYDVSAIEVTFNDSNPDRSKTVNIKARLINSTSDGVLGQNITFKDGASVLGYGITNSTGWAEINWSIDSGETVGVHTINATYGGNVSEYYRAGYNDTESVTVWAATAVSQVILNSSNPTAGDVVRIDAKLEYDNTTVIEDQNISFYYGSTLIGSSLTNSTGWAVIAWDTTGVSGETYSINATYAGNSTIYTQASHNDTGQATVIASNVMVYSTAISPDEVEPQDTLTSVNITINNTGTANAVNVNITLSFLYPNNTQVTSWGPQNEYNDSCGTLTNGQLCSVLFSSYQVNSAETTSGAYRLNITMKWSTGSNVNNTPTFQVYYLPDNISSTISPSSIAPGEYSNYTINVTNPWSSALTNVNVTPDCPADINCTCEDDDCLIGTVTSGNTGTKRIIANSSESAIGDYTLSCYVNYTNPNSNIYQKGPNWNQTLTASETIQGNVTFRTYRNSSYSEEYPFFDSSGATLGNLVYIEANVTNSTGGVTGQAVTAGFIRNSVEEGTKTLTEIGSGIYRGAWDSSSAPAGIYWINATVNTTIGNLTTDYFHIYSGANISAYHMDYNNNGINESIMENKHLIAVYDGEENTNQSMLYLEQKDTNVSYTFGGISDTNSLGKGEVTHENPGYLKMYGFSSTNTGENLASADMNLKVNLTKIVTNEEVFTSYDPGSSYFAITSGDYWIGEQFDTSAVHAGYVLSKVSVYINDLGSTAPLVVDIRAGTSTLPNTTVLATKSIAAADVSDSFGWYDAIFSNPITLSEGGNYWLVLRTSDAIGYGWMSATSAGYAGSFAHTSNQNEGGWTSNSGYDMSFKAYRSWTTETHTAFNTTIKMMDDNVDYLVYKLHNFDQNIENIGSIFSVISGTLGSSVLDDRYYLEDDTNGLVVSLINNTWNNYTSSNYTIIYDNSTASDSVSDNVIAWIRFNETENITFTDVGLWNDTIYNTEGFRIKYNAVSASPTDEINYILTFTVGGYDTIHRWMPTIESGEFPQPNIMSDVFPPEITIVNPSNNSNLLNAATWTWLNITTNEDTYCQWNDTVSDFVYGTGTDFEIGQGSNAHAYNYTSITNNSAYDFWYKCNDSFGNINTEVAHHHFWNSDNISISIETSSYSYSPGASGWISGTATYEGTDDMVPDERVDIFINDSPVNLSSGREWSSNSDWLSGDYLENQTANNSDDELSLAHMMHPLVEINAVNPPYNYKNNLTVMAKRDWGGNQWGTTSNGYYHYFDTPPETLNYTFYFTYTLFQTSQNALDRLSHIATFRNEDNDCNIFGIARYEADNHLYIWDGPCSPDLAESRNTAYRIDTGVVITDNTQYKVNVLFDGSEWKIYVNDILEETIDNAVNEGKNDKVWRIEHSAANSHDEDYATNITINYSIQYHPDGMYESNITEIDGAVLNVKPIWHASEPAGTNYTVFVSADNGDSWCNVTNNTRLDSGCGLGSGNSLKYRVNFSTTDIFQTAEIQNLTLDYEYGPKTDSDGFYNFSFTAPPVDGEYIIENNITGADGLTGENSTWILVSAPPTAGDIECNNSGVWGACNYSFYENITGIRVNCTPAAGKIITNATYLITNTPDSETFLDADNATSVLGDWWIYELNPEINVSDSGEWKITAQCIDDVLVSDSNQTTWETSWGWLSVELVDPITAANVSKDGFFTFESKVTCIGGECGSINATLDPEQSGDNTDSPIITYANLWPKSVANGDTMHFDVRAGDDEGIAGITVDIGGIDTISLTLLEGTEYDGRWGGQWVVHDAKIEDYNATIRAVNNQGEYTEHILGWRDPLRIGDGIGVEVYDGQKFVDLDEKIAVAHDSIDGEITFGDGSNPYGGWTAPGTTTNIRNHITANATAVYLGVVDYNSVNCNKTDGRNYGDVDYYDPDAADVSCWRSNQGNYFKIFTVTLHSFAGQWHFNGKVTDLDYASPEIESNQTYPYEPIAGDNITINVIVSDYNIPGIEWVNYTLKNPKGANVIDNENGTFYYNSSLWTTYWNSSYYVIDMLGEWNVTVVAGDGDGNTTSSSWLFDVVDKFVIPTTVGATPFYTTSDNPQSDTYSACLANMTLGDSCTNNWTVNATGPSNTTWEFFVLYNATTYSGYFTDNQTEKVNITIQDLTAPSITITLPENETYVTSSIWFNVSLDEAGSWCGYSLDGAANVTMDGSGTEWNKENATMTEGSHNVTFSCNDTSGNMNASVVTEYFTVDTIPPQITILFPQNNSYNTQSIWFNATATDSQRPVDWCGYTLDHSTMPAWAIYWSYIRNITINNTANSENLTDHQVFINLTSSNFDFTKANSDGNDTRFTWLNSTSGVEENTSYWLESWDSVGEEAIIWVNMPFVNSTSDGYIYMYYGNTGADTDSNASEVFDWTFKGNFTISSSADTEAYPDISFGNDTFLIAWHDYRSGTDWDVYAEMYNHTGGLSKDEFVIANAANDQTYPWVSFGGDKFFITWDDLRDGNWNYYAEMDNSTGDVSKDDFAVSTDAYPQGFGSTAFGDDRFFTLWYDKRLGDNTKYTVFGELYNTTGDVSKDEFQISEESAIRTFSSMAFGSEKFLMVWQYENTTVRNIQAKTYNSTGDVINDTFEVDAITLNITRPSSAFGNNRFFIAWIDNPSGDYNVYGKIYDQDFNTVKDTFMISTSCSLNSETSIVMYPSIAFGNGKFFITWHGGGSGDNNILAKIYDMDGNVLKDEFDISTASNNQENPSVAFGNGRFFIAWCDNRSGTNWDIYADLFKDTEYLLTEPTITIGSEENTSVTMLNDTAIHFYAQNTSMTEGSHNVVFSCNDTVGNMNSTEAIEYFTVNTTDITYPQYSLNQTNSTEAGEDVLFSLYWEDNNALAGYIFSFDNGNGTLYNDSYVEMTGTGNWSNVTKSVNSTVGSTIRWRVYANDTAGNMNMSLSYSFNTTTTNININIHETDNSTDKAWSILNIPLDFNYYCYAGMGDCDDTYASDSDGSTANFTIDNIGDTVDVLAYVTSDFNSSTFMICSSTDDDNDGDDAACKDSPATGQNGADNLQIYINVSGSWGWYNVSNSNRDGSSYALAVDCDVPTDTNATGIDFQVRAPYGTQGSYGTTITFVAYHNICSDGEEGTYYTP